MTDTNSTRTLLDCEPFTRHQAFTLWRIEPHPDGPGKPPIKVPVHYDGVTHHSMPNARRGTAGNPAPPLSAQQAREWQTHHHASAPHTAVPRQMGYVGAGFRPAGTGLVCIDLDDCITPEGWSAGALHLMARFPGALIEQSVSGTGAHIWFTVMGPGPGKRVKQRTPLGAIEVYSEGQFIACGTVLGGDACVDHTAAVTALVAEFWGAAETMREDRAASNDWDEKSPEQQAVAVEQLRSALAAGYNPDNRDDWLRAGQALVSLGETGYEIWAEWSASSTRFPGGDGLDKWDGFSGDRTDYRAIFAQAARAGWINPAGRPALGDAAQIFGAGAPMAALPGPGVAGLPTGAVLERPANVPDPAAGGELSFMAAAQGLITASLARVTTALASPESRVRLRYDTFKEADFISIGDEPWHEITDVDLIDLRFRFEQRGFKPVSADCMGDAVRYACSQNRVDSAQVWLDGLTWDGVERIDGLFPTFYGTADTPYTRACGSYLFTALAGRTLSPGCQADMVIILVGVQGASKTTSVEVLAPDPANFGEVDLSKKDADVVRAIHGKQVMELAELQGLSGRALEATKAWVRRREEKWTPKFSNKEATYLRRAVIIGTTNENEFLDDPTGERRWLPLTVGQVRSGELRKIRDQLWAEGAARYRKNIEMGRDGIDWADAERLAKAQHAQHKVHDDWIEPITKWLNTPPTPIPGHPLDTEKRGSKPLVLADVLMGALNMTPDRIDLKASKRAAKIMRSLNYGPRTVWVDGVDVRRWVVL